MFFITLFLRLLHLFMNESYIFPDLSSQKEKRNIDWLPLAHAPNLKPKAGPPLGIKPATFHFVGQRQPTESHWSELKTNF